MNTEDVSVNSIEDTNVQTDMECEEKAVEKKQKKTAKKKLPTLYIQTDYDNKVTKEKITGKALKIIIMKRKSEKILRLTETGKKLIG